MLICPVGLRDSFAASQCQRRSVDMSSVHVEFVYGRSLRLVSSQKQERDLGDASAVCVFVHFSVWTKWPIFTNIGLNVLLNSVSWNDVCKEVLENYASFVKVIVLCIVKWQHDRLRKYSLSLGLRAITKKLLDLLKCLMGKTCLYIMYRNCKSAVTNMATVRIFEVMPDIFNIESIGLLKLFIEVK
jgi:hypothetical protein